jgi:hypothetical protein
MTTLLGFDYALGRTVERTRVEWQAQMLKIRAAGGWRRVEQGETFVHTHTGRIALEIYSNVTLPTEGAIT